MVATLCELVFAIQFRKSGIRAHAFRRQPQRNPKPDRGQLISHCTQLGERHPKSSHQEDAQTKVAVQPRKRGDSNLRNEGGEQKPLLDSVWLVGSSLGQKLSQTFLGVCRACWFELLMKSLLPNQKTYLQDAPPIFLLAPGAEFLTWDHKATCCDPKMRSCLEHCISLKEVIASFLPSLGSLRRQTVSPQAQALRIPMFKLRPLHFAIWLASTTIPEEDYVDHCEERSLCRVSLWLSKPEVGKGSSGSLIFIPLVVYSPHSKTKIPQKEKVPYLVAKQQACHVGW